MKIPVIKTVGQAFAMAATALPRQLMTSWIGLGVAVGLLYFIQSVIGFSSFSGAAAFLVIIFASYRSARRLNMGLGYRKPKHFSVWAKASAINLLSWVPAVFFVAALVNVIPLALAVIQLSSMWADNGPYSPVVNTLSGAGRVIPFYAAGFILTMPLARLGVVGKSYFYGQTPFTIRQGWEATRGNSVRLALITSAPIFLILPFVFSLISFTADDVVEVMTNGSTLIMPMDLTLMFLVVTATWFMIDAMAAISGHLIWRHFSAEGPHQTGAAPMAENRSLAALSGVFVLATIMWTVGQGWGYIVNGVTAAAILVPYADTIGTSREIVDSHLASEQAAGKTVAQVSAAINAAPRINSDRYRLVELIPEFGDKFIAKECVAQLNTMLALAPPEGSDDAAAQGELVYCLPITCRSPFNGRVFTILMSSHHSAQPAWKNTAHMTQMAGNTRLTPGGYCNVDGSVSAGYQG